MSSVTSINLTDSGASYTDIPDITISLPDDNVRSAILSFTLSGSKISSIAIDSGGNFYDSDTTLTISAPTADYDRDSVSYVMNSLSLNPASADHDGGLQTFLSDISVNNNYGAYWQDRGAFNVYGLFPSLDSTNFVYGGFGNGGATWGAGYSYVSRLNHDSDESFSIPIGYDGGLTADLDVLGNYRCVSYHVYLPPNWDDNENTIDIEFGKILNPNNYEYAVRLATTNGNQLRMYIRDFTGRTNDNRYYFLNLNAAFSGWLRITIVIRYDPSQRRLFAQLYWAENVRRDANLKASLDDYNYGVNDGTNQERLDAFNEVFPEDGNIRFKINNSGGGPIGGYNFHQRIDNIDYFVNTYFTGTAADRGHYFVGNSTSYPYPSFPNFNIARHVIQYTFENGIATPNVYQQGSYLSLDDSNDILSAFSNRPFAGQLKVSQDSTQATAEILQLNTDGVITSVRLIDSGIGYLDGAITATFSDQNKENYRATAVGVLDSDNLKLSGINLTYGGGGYLTAPTVTINTPSNVAIAKDFIIGEIVKQTLPSGVIMSGEIAKYSDSDNKLHLIHVGGDDGKYHEFVTGAIIIGQTSNASGVINTIVEQNNISNNEQNDDFSSVTLEFLDFTEDNPFGDPENN